MEKTSQTTSRRGGLFAALLFLGSVCLPGCHDWPDERGTAIEAQNILRDLGRIETVSDANVQEPAIYKSPPKKFKQIVGGGEEWKLIYFCRHHTAEEMKQIINEQFATKLFDEKGKSNTVADYTITANPATNQLIARCPTEKDADAIMEVIKETDIPPIQVRINCMVSELYADLTVDRETRMLIQNLFGEGFKLGGQPDNGNLAFPGAELRDPARAKFGLKIGISRDNVDALVDILVSRGYMKILMNPSLEVVNGQTAKIQSKQHQPLQQITYTTGQLGGGFILGTETEYYDIIDSLQITPHVYADGYIGLETQAQIAAYLTPEGIKQTPNVTERTITNKDNRIRLGESLIIGGIRKSEKRDVIRGVPILKDIPLLNVLFSGRDFEERATEVIFILTPSISTGGKPNQEMTEMLRERHSSPTTQTLQEKVMDPLGIKARAQEQQRQLDNAREARQQYETRATMTRLETMEAGHQIEDLQEELDLAKVKVEQADVAASKAEAQQKTATEAKAKEQAAQAKPAEAPKVETVENKKADPPKNGPPAPQPKAEPPKEQPPQSKTDAPKDPAQPKPDAPKEQAASQPQNNQQPKPAEQKAQESQADDSKAKELMQD